MLVCDCFATIFCAFISISITFALDIDKINRRMYNVIVTRAKKRYAVARQKVNNEAGKNRVKKMQTALVARLKPVRYYKITKLQKTSGGKFDEVGKTQDIASRSCRNGGGCISDDGNRLRRGKIASRHRLDGRLDGYRPYTLQSDDARSTRVHHSRYFRRVLLSQRKKLHYAT